MKKLKNNWFSAGMALAMMWGIGLGMLPQEVKAFNNPAFCTASLICSNGGTVFCSVEHRCEVGGDYVSCDGVISKCLTGVGNE